MAQGLTLAACLHAIVSNVVRAEDERGKVPVKKNKEDKQIECYRILN